MTVAYMIYMGPKEWLSKEIAFQVQRQERLWFMRFCFVFLTEAERPGFHPFLQLTLTQNHSHSL